MTFVECYLNGFDRAAQRLHRFVFDLRGKQLDQLVLVHCSQRSLLRCRSGIVGSLLLGALLTHIEPGLVGRQSRLLVGEAVVETVGEHRPLPGIIFGRIRVGSLGGCDGLLRIFGGSADRLRGSRKIDFFSSHHFKVLLFVSPRASARYGNRAKITIFGNYSSL